MGHPDPRPTDVAIPASSDPVGPLGAVPSPLGRRVLAFVFVVLLEYWLVPPLLGITNYAGPWSSAGNLLFALLAASLVVFVFRPLTPHLRRALRSRPHRLAFHAVWIGAFVIGLFATNFVQFTSGPSSPVVQLGTTTVYSPFGAWPTLTTYVPALQLWATWNVEGPTVLLMLGLLSASSVVLGPMRAPAACPLPATDPRGRRTRLASLGVLAPLGFISGCPGCAPVYFAALSTVAPAAVAGATTSDPLVPFIGFAGLLYLIGFALAVWLIRRATEPQTPVPTPPGEA